MKNMKNLVVTQDPQNEVPFEVMARSIEDIGTALKKIGKTRVTRKMLVALIQDDTKFTKTTIERVLDSYEGLESKYLKPASKIKN